MNVLMEKFPEELEIQGKCYSIGWDFRTVLSCNERIEQRRHDVTEGELLSILEMFYKDCRYYTEEHVEKDVLVLLLWKGKGKEKLPKEDCGN